MKFLVPSMGSMIQRASRAPACAELLAEEPVVGKGAAEHLADGLLGLAIRLGHRRLVGLDGDLEAAAVVPQRDLAGGARRLDGGGERRGCSVRVRVTPSHSPALLAGRALNTSSASTTTGMPP